MTRSGTSIGTSTGTSIGTSTGTRIGLTFDTESDEERVLTAHALEAIGDVLFLEANDSLPAQLQLQRPDIVLNLARGGDAPARLLHPGTFDARCVSNRITPDVGNIEVFEK